MRSLKTSNVPRPRERSPCDVRCHIITITKLSKSKWARDSQRNRTTPHHSSLPERGQLKSEEPGILPTPRSLSTAPRGDLWRALYSITSFHFVKRSCRFVQK